MNRPAGIETSLLSQFTAVAPRSRASSASVTARIALVSSASVSLAASAGLSAAPIGWAVTRRRGGA